MNAKISIFVICVEVIIYLLLHNLRITVPLINSKPRKNGSENPLISVLTRFDYMANIQNFPL